jgi:hypothetical protein
MIEFKVVASPILGQHRLLTIFPRTLPTETWANCGVLTMRAYEADAMKAQFHYQEWCDV